MPSLPMANYCDNDESISPFEQIVSLDSTILQVEESSRRVFRLAVEVKIANANLSPLTLPLRLS